MTYLPSNVGIQKAPTSKALDVKGDTNIDSTTVATSATTGAFTVLGGVGIAGDLYVGGSVNFASSIFNNITVRNTVFSTPPSASTTILSSTVVTEANARFYMDATGKLYFGVGGVSSTYDVQLGRSSTGVLGLTGGLSASGASTFSSNVTVSGFLAVGSGFTCSATGDVSALSLTLSGGLITNTLASLTTGSLVFKTTGVSGNTFTIDASGNMIWNAGMTLSTSASGSVYAGKMVFNHLNVSTSFYLSTSLTTFISGASDNINYYGNHTFNGAVKFTGGIVLNSLLSMLSLTTGFKTFSVSSSGSLQWYSTTGVAGDAQLTSDSTGNSLQSTGNLTVLGALSGNGITSFGELKVVGGNLTLHNGPFNTDTTITSTGTANRALTTPDASGVIVVDTAAQILTNKTMSGLSLGQVTKVCPGYDNATNVSAFNYTGLAVDQGGLYGISDSSRSSGSSKTLIVTNSSINPLIIIPNSNTVPAADRIRTLDGNVISLLPGNSIILSYDNSSSSWGVVSSPSMKLAYYVGTYSPTALYNGRYDSYILASEVESYNISTITRTGSRGGGAYSYSEFQIPAGLYEVTLATSIVFSTATGTLGAVRTLDVNINTPDGHTYDVNSLTFPGGGIGTPLAASVNILKFDLAGTLSIGWNFIGTNDTVFSYPVADGLVAISIKQIR